MIASFILFNERATTRSRALLRLDTFDFLQGSLLFFSPALTLCALIEFRARFAIVQLLFMGCADLEVARVASKYVALFAAKVDLT